MRLCIQTEAPSPVPGKGNQISIRLNNTVSHCKTVERLIEWTQRQERRAQDCIPCRTDPQVERPQTRTQEHAGTRGALFSRALPG